MERDRERKSVYVCEREREGETLTKPGNIRREIDRER